MEKEVKVLVTGANGFIGKNLCLELENKKVKVYKCDVDTTDNQLEDYTKDCEFVFHLAGVNRPKETSEFMEGNFGFTTKLIETLAKNKNKSPILMSSSVQAELDNDYGKSKKAGEEYLFNYGKSNNVGVYIYRLPNVFGKWCKPNYNSAIATFCNNVARDIDIVVNNRETEMTLVYIDDVVKCFIENLNNTVNSKEKYQEVKPSYKAKLGQIVDLIYSFKNSREELTMPNFENGLEKKLYSTYLAYLSEDDFSYPLKMNVDNRGSFTEFLKSDEKGQVSVNVAKPGITKGNHYHHTKNEKFLVVSGEGIIRFRKVNTKEIIEYKVNGEKLEVVDIPCGYTHNIENVGKTDLVTVMWVNEIFDKDNPDTYFLEV